jgi:hypothetical protein
MSLWHEWFQILTRASQQVLASSLAFCADNIYGLLGAPCILTGGLLTLWILVPSYLPEIPTNPHKATINCTENGRDCENIDFKVRLLPNPSGALPTPISEDVVVQVMTSRKRSNATTYHILWPGRASPGPSDIDWLPVTVVPHDVPQITHLMVKGAAIPEDMEPPPPGLPPYLPVEFDQFTFVWVKGKERQNFTDWQLRLWVVIHPGPKRQNTLSLAVGLQGSQRLLQDVPDSGSSSFAFPEFGAALHTYHSNKVIVVYTEKNLGILSQYSLVIAGILIGLGGNLLTQQVVMYCEKRQQ